MKFNIDKICSEFLDHFLTIIQDPDAINAATFFSGFLRANVLETNIIKKMSDQSLSYIPLSAVIKAGLVNEDGSFNGNNDARAQRVKFFIDKERVQGALEALKAENKPFTEMQKLALVTSIQEASNRLSEGPLKFFAANLQCISNEEAMNSIAQQIKDISARSLTPIMDKIDLNPMEWSLTPESILCIKEQQARFIEAGITSSEIEVPDDELPEPPTELKSSIPASTQIQILDELLPILAQDDATLEESARLEHKAKLELIHLQTKILAVTARDAWDVRYQWMYPGSMVDVGSKKITLPSSISQILKVITDTFSQKNNESYLEALNTIRQIAVDYENDWYRWGRNSLTFFTRPTDEYRKILDSLRPPAPSPKSPSNGD